MSKPKHILQAEYAAYTDGSKTQYGTGAGFVVYYKRESIQADNFSLPDHATVFQAEIGAIYQCARYIRETCISCKVKYVKILCDSQAAILALASHEI